jgi:hypothetical protein
MFKMGLTLHALGFGVMERIVVAVPQLIIDPAIKFMLEPRLTPKPKL